LDGEKYLLFSTVRTFTTVELPKTPKT